MSGTGAGVDSPKGAAPLTGMKPLRPPPPVPPPIHRIGRGISSQDLKTILASPTGQAAAAAAAALAATNPNPTTPKAGASGPFSPSSPALTGSAGPLPDSTASATASASAMAAGSSASTNGDGSGGAIARGAFTKSPAKAVVIQRGTSSSNAASKEIEREREKQKEKEERSAAIAAGVDGAKPPATPPLVKAASTAATPTGSTGKPNLSSSSAVAQLAIAKANADKRLAAEKAAAAGGTAGGSTTAAAALSTASASSSSSAASTTAGTPKASEHKNGTFGRPQPPSTPAPASAFVDPKAAAAAKAETPRTSAAKLTATTTVSGPVAATPRGRSGGSSGGVLSPTASGAAAAGSPSMGGFDDDIDVPLSLPAPPPVPGGAKKPDPLATDSSVAGGPSIDDDSPLPDDERPLPTPPPPPKTVGGAVVSGSSSPTPGSGRPGSGHARSASSAAVATVTNKAAGSSSGSGNGSDSKSSAPSSFLGAGAAHGIDPIHTSPNTSVLGINAAAFSKDLDRHSASGKAGQLLGSDPNTKTGEGGSGSSGSSGSASGGSDLAGGKKRDYSFAHNLLHQWANVNNQMTYGLYTVKRFALFLKKVNAQVALHALEVVKIMKNEKLKNERLYKDAMARFVDMFTGLQDAINGQTTQLEAFSKNVQTQVADPLEAFYKEAENARGLLVKREAKATLGLVEMKKRVVKERTNCMQLWEDLKLSDREKRGEELLEKTPKRAKKIQGILEVIDKKRKKVHGEFERFLKTVDEANHLQEEYFRREMPALCNEMENMEKRRLKELEKHMAVFAVLQRNLVPPLEKQCSTLQKFVSDAVGVQQIQAWVTAGVAKHGMPPPIVPFVYDLPCDLPDLLGEEKWKVMIQSDTAKLMKDQVKVQEKKHKPVEKPDVECVKMTCAVAGADPAHLSCKEGDVVIVTRKAGDGLPDGWWAGKHIDMMGVASEKVVRFEKKLAEECKLNEKIDFRFLFQLKHGLSYFTQQLEREFSAENMHFWRDVAAFRKWCAQTGADRDTADLQTRAKAIADKFVRTSAATQVNLRSDVMEAVLKEVDSGAAGPSAFNPAQQEIFNLLERDSFPRFKSSPLFAAMMEEYGITVVIKKPGEDEF